MTSISAASPKDLKELPENSRILSVWKPHAYTHFHLGHAAMLAYLVALAKDPSVNLQVMVGAFGAPGADGAATYSSNVTTTRQFLAETLDLDVPVMNSAAVSSELVDRLQEGLKSLLESDEVGPREFVATHSWASNSTVPACLAGAVCAGGWDYLLTSAKHAPIWEFVSAVVDATNELHGLTLVAPEPLYISPQKSWTNDSDPEVAPMGRASHIVPLYARSHEEMVNILQDFVEATKGSEPVIESVRTWSAITTDGWPKAPEKLAALVEPYRRRLDAIGTRLGPVLRAEKYTNSRVLMQLWYENPVVSGSRLSADLLEALKNPELDSSPLEFRKLYLGGAMHIADHVLFKSDGAGDEPSYALELRTLVSKTQLVDPLMYLVKKRYRDHSTHQLNVALLGSSLLSVHVKPNETLLDWFKHTSGLGSRAEVLDAWWIASLLHDHAYPIAFLVQALQDIRVIHESTGGNGLEAIGQAYAEYVSDLLHGTLNTKAIGPILHGSKEAALEADIAYKGLVEQMAKSVMTDAKGNEIKDFVDACSREPYDHGIMSALNVWLKAQKKPDPRLKLAIQAIALHNLVGPKAESTVRLSMSKHPIAALLRLCDELQEWSRQSRSGKREFRHAVTETVVLLEQLPDGSMQYPQELAVQFVREGSEDAIEPGWDDTAFAVHKKAALSSILWDWKGRRPTRLSFAAVTNVSAATRV